MEAIFILVFSYLGLLLSKIFFFRSSFYLENEQEIVEKNPTLRMSELLYIPFSSLFMRMKASKHFRVLFKLSELIGVMSFTLLSISFISLYESSSSPYVFENFIHFCFYTAIAVSLLYLAIYDLINFSVPAIFTVRLLFFAVVFNIVIGLTKVISLEIFDYKSFEHINVGTIENLMAFILIFAGTSFLVYISDEKGMGKGDTDINGAVGLGLGLSGTLVFAFATILIGSVVGVLYSMAIKKFKDVQIPMVPIILLGFTISLGFSDYLIDLIFAL